RTEQLRLALRIDVVHQLEGRQGGRRLRARDRGRQLPRLLEDAAGGHATVDEPDAMGLRRGHRLTAQYHLQGLWPSDDPRQAAAAAQTRNEAERQLREAEPGTRPADAQVAGERDLEPSAEAEPVHGGDEGLGNAEEIVEQGAPGPGLLLRIVRG